MALTLSTGKSCACPNALGAGLRNVGQSRNNARRVPTTRQCKKIFSLQSRNGVVCGLSMPRDSMGTVEVKDYSTFVRFLHLASPYVVGHRNKSFVIMIPGEVMMDKERLRNILDDVLLLHGLGCKLVLVAGSRELIDAELSHLISSSEGDSVFEGKIVGGYRVSGTETMNVVLAENGAAVNQISAMLSKGPPVPMMRRHAKRDSGSSDGVKSSSAVKVVSGNFVAAKRRGVVNGIDFGYSGSVSHVHVEAIKSQLNDGNIVLLTCLGISSIGELLNCSVYDVAAKTAIELSADKFICFTGKDVRRLNLPHYLPLEEAKMQIACGTLGSCSNIVPYSSRDEGDREAVSRIEPLLGGGIPSTSVMFDLDQWSTLNLPFEVLAGISTCHHGISRSHLVDFQEEGALLLEMYSRDGISGVCMIASDIYQGIRHARMEDISQISQLLNSFLSYGYDLPFVVEDVGANLDRVMVLERDGDVLACAVYSVLGKGMDEKLVVEINALIVSEAHRNNGFGDSILDYIEQDLRRKNVGVIVLVPITGSCDWFVDRGFEYQGLAKQNCILPEDRSHTCEPIAKLYSKSIVAIDSSLADLPAGRRIGF